jgi:hypothetical protein
MSKVEMKVGEWYEQKDGERWQCIAEYPKSIDKQCRFICCTLHGDLDTFRHDGSFYEDAYGSMNDLVRHLPGCTGFDWQEPKFKVGDVVYATKPENTKEHPSWDSLMDDTTGIPLQVTKVDAKDCTYACEVKGVDDWFWYHETWLSKEQPAAQYRPFANDEEYAPHFDRKVLRSTNASPETKGQYLLTAFDEYQVWTADNFSYSYEQMYEDGRKFADTNEPFGVKIN